MPFSFATAGSGKTHIAARIMQLHYLPQLRAAKAHGQPAKALVFLAPTNPLVAQVRHYGSNECSAAMRKH